jgi:tetratricopeptide (TPR) repeat protein
VSAFACDFPRSADFAVAGAGCLRSLLCVMLRTFIVLTILGWPAFPAAQGIGGRDSFGEVAVAAASAALIRGAELAGEDRWQDALSAFQSAINWQPTLGAAHFNAGVALGVLGRGEEAIAAYREALKLSPPMPEALINMGAELTRGGRPEEAMTSLERAVRLSPRSARARHNLGVALAALGRLEAALRAFEGAAALAPDDVAIRRALNVARTNVERRHGLRRVAIASDRRERQSR